MITWSDTMRISLKYVWSVFYLSLDQLSFRKCNPLNSLRSRDISQFSACLINLSFVFAFGVCTMSQNIVNFVSTKVFLFRFRERCRMNKSILLGQCYSLGLGLSENLIRHQTHRNLGWVSPCNNREFRLKLSVASRACLWQAIHL